MYLKPLSFSTVSIFAPFIDSILLFDLFQARVYLLSSGFSLAFGSMFAKTYRVHRIFTHSGGGVCKDKMLQDTQLISLVCALLLLDGLVVTMWVVADPMERHLSNLTLEISLTDRSVVYQPQVNIPAMLHPNRVQPVEYFRRNFRIRCWVWIWYGMNMVGSICK